MCRTRSGIRYKIAGGYKSEEAIIYIDRLFLCTKGRACRDTTPRGRVLSSAETTPCNPSVNGYLS